MTGWRRAARDIVLLALLIAAYFVVPVQYSSDGLRSGVVSMLLIAAAGAVLIWQVLLLVDDPDRQVEGLLFALVVGVLTFALAFYRLEIEDPDQIAGLTTRLDSLYFTMTTLLTIGFGDIHAEGQIARAVVLLQMVFNVAVIATGASTLTSRVRSNAQRRAEVRRGSLPTNAPESDV
ncbi:potassium channel family protein [Nocardioides sp. CN2-186]|uniref:potassium channel family protein n=1 Tax=Nocardioides tweenelious TaxID=3156607 RepID=UPI0032B38B67